MLREKKRSLLDEEDEGGAEATDLGIRVNKAYAARFEHNKQREELHRLQAKYPEEAEKLARKIAREAAKAAGVELPAGNGGEDSSEDEEEDEGEIPDDTEAKIFDTLLRIRKKDPAIYQKDVQFFEEPADDEEGGGAAEEAGGKGSKKAKAMFLKDMIAKQALEYGPGGGSSDEEDEAGAGKRGGEKRHPKAYDPEQENLRKAFLHAVTEADEGEEGDGMGGVLRLRSKGQADEADGDADGSGEAPAGGKKQKKGAKKGAKKEQLIEAYFGSEGELDPSDKFLKEYIMNKGWVDREDGYVPSYHEVVGDEDDDEEQDGAGELGTGDVDDEEDERYLREMDVFEAKYNFRYEEPGADRIITHPRNTEGTVRKPDDKRKRQRDAKKQRLEEAEEAAREEVKRLKNLKKQEIENKLDKLRHVAGAAAPAAASLDDMLEGDFDPEEWDKKMAAAFDDAYYDAEEDLEGLQDDLDLLGGEEGLEDDDGDEDGEEEDGADGEGKPVRFSTLKKKLKEVDALSEDPEGEEGGGKKAPADPEAAARQRAEMQRLLEEYYKLDYEDNVGGIKTRFRYKEVPASTFGLSVDDILRLDDKALNQVAGIKRLAPYREDAAKQRPNYKALEMVKGEIVKHQRRQYKKREWQKRSGDGQRGGQFWREKGDAGEAAGAGPGSTAQAAGASAEGQKLPRKREEGSGQPGEEERRQKIAKHRSASEAKDAAGPGPGSQAASAGREHAGMRKGQGGKPREGRSGDAGNGYHKKQHHGKQPMDPQQARLASYAVPTLKKDFGGPHADQAVTGKKRKHGDRDQGKPSAAAAEPADGLTRAQRKNLKRSQKRASKRQGETVAGAD